MKKKHLKLRNIMLAGTGSDVGKSIIATGLCRIFKQDGYAPCPFKAQNMALNSYATPDGFEIGRAQAVQAEAAGLACHTDMNPLLLKPSSDRTSQVVLNGKPIGNRDAYEYFRRDGRDMLRKEVYAAFDRLAQKYNPIVLEGAGSISEINLRDTDLVNMPMARYADADVILVSDIDRGGVFASVYGSIMLQNEEDRKRIKGVIVNKFRGDMRLFDEGRHMMEQICGVPVIGVVPYFKDVHIEEEDSVALSHKYTSPDHKKINVAVVLLRHISNFTDFNVLELDQRVNLYYASKPADVELADIVIVPGSKSTISDLMELRSSGMAQAIMKARRNGKTIIGICGGYQIMGESVDDPYGTEGDVRSQPGLGLLPCRTILTKEKVTRQVEFKLAQASSDVCKGYEIHMGTTEIGDSLPLNRLSDGALDGCFVDDKCMGTYIHGWLDNPDVVEMILQPYKDKSGSKSAAGVVDYDAYRQSQYDLLACNLREYIDMELLYQILSIHD